MPLPPETDSDFPSDIADKVDDALESLWAGDSNAMARLLDDESTSGEDVGRVLKGLAGTGDPSSPDLKGEAEARGYHILREIGRGGMGVVYEAMQEGTKRVVAVKVMLAGPFASESVRRRFEREVELAARLQHPGIVRILESGLLASGQRYFAMDYVEGVTLDRYLAASKPGPRRILQLLAELCDAVDHAHANGVIHRDLKPSNVLIDEQGKPHILDFGLAKAADHADTDALTAGVSTPGQVLGTLRYLSPEQAVGESDEIDTRTDVYTLGVILFEALTGAAPFDTTGRPSEVIQRITEAQPASPCSLSKRVDGEVETIILKALEKEKARRYRSARELGEEIRRYLAGEPILARRPSSLYVLRKKLAKHRRSYGGAAAALVILLAAAFGWMWLKQHELIRGRREALRIQVALEAGRTELFLGPAESVHNQHPELPEARLVHAQAQFRMARMRGDDVWKEAAMSLLRRAINADPPDLSCAALLSEIQDDPASTDREGYLNQVLTRTPDAAEVWYLWSFATLDLQTAVQYAEKAVSADPRHELAWERLAHLYQQTGNVDGAINAAKELINLGEDSFKWEMFEGDVFTRHGRYEEAVRHYTAVAEAFPGRKEPYRARALVHLCLKDYAGAADDYSLVARAVRSTGDWELYRRATPLWITGRLEEAAADYRIFCESRSYATYADARLFLILHDMARSDMAGRDESEAQRALEEAGRMVEDGLDNAPPGSWLKKIFECFAGEIAPGELAGAANPANPEQICEAYFYAGEKCLLDGRIGQACEWFRRCVETGVVFDPDSASLDPMNEYHLALWRSELLCLDRETE
ncbi:MAG: protein kinase [Phycisphaerales bacterium]|nr:MAG: protein kinase [Phycisphaerales bacterium]